MERLEELERINRVCRELHLHLGVTDKDLAEYLLVLCKNSKSDKNIILSELKAEGVVIPDQLLNSLLSISNESRQEFKSLSMPNNPKQAQDLLLDRDDYITRSNRRLDDHRAKNPEPLQAADDQLRERKRLSSPERFELKQLLASGAIDHKKHPHLVAQLQEDRQARRVDVAGPPPVEFDVELADTEPAFLRGANRLVADLSPVRVVRNPTGTLARAAMQGAVSAAARRERKQAEQRGTDKEALEEKRQDLLSSWNDPMPTSDKLFASGIKNNRPRESELPLAPHGIAKPKTVKEERDSLPIAQLRKELMAAIKNNQVLVVIGETGSGKTTQITQYLVEEGYASNSKRIGCTQPRRVAAMSVAKRVADEVGCPLGTEVGYTIRFEDCTSRSTIIKYMTDGMLLRECLVDPLLTGYSVIILDEAHERTVHTDVLFGLCKKAVSARPELRLIVTSATLDASKFSEYFDDCPVFTIPGRSFPVDVVWSADPVPDYLEGAINSAINIHCEEPPGDILIFLTGQEEIDTAVEVLHDRSRRLHTALKLLPLPVYSALPNDLQSRIFAPAPDGYRKAVIATNIAETSLTIDGIRYVVDPGFCKQKSHTARLSMDTLQVTPISQAQARQRAGRAGRTGPGKCYRLYTEKAFADEMLPSAVPEIQRTNLSLTVLTLKAMGINDLVGFDFMDPPALPSLLSAMDGLFQLGALDDEGFLTRLGRRMAEFPLDPPFSKCLLASIDFKCSDAVLMIVSLLSASGSGSLFYRPRDRQEQADQKRSRFASRDGDLITYLKVYDMWLDQGRSAHWCQEHFVQQRTLKRAFDIRKQLHGILSRFSNGEQHVRDSVSIRKALCAGLFRQAARRDRTGEEGGYRTLLDDHPAAIHPSSVLHHSQQSTPPGFLLYSELVMTGREWLRDVTPVDPRWLVEAAPSLYRHPQEGRLSERQRQERIVPLFNPHDKSEDWRLSKQAANFRAARSTR